MWAEARLVTCELRLWTRHGKHSSPSSPRAIRSHHPERRRVRYHALPPQIATETLQWRPALEAVGPIIHVVTRLVADSHLGLYALRTVGCIGYVQLTLMCEVMSTVCCTGITSSVSLTPVQTTASS